ncbi:MAG: glycosyltransferase family 8 protein [Prolixibacteraceae bacterium]|jgi:lipopolysaccharide biosynthesis glycosyltransferase
MFNIALLSSKSFAPHAAATIVSVLENNKDLKFNILIFTIDFDESTVEKFKQIESKYQSEISVIKLTNDDISIVPQIGRWGFYALGRLVIIKLLSEKYDSVLILGADTIIQGSIKEVFELDMTNYAFAGADDMDNCIKHKERLGLPAESIYSNLDFYLINFKFWREKNINEKVFLYVQNNFNKIQVGDQDVINVICNGYIKELPITYNMQSPYYYHKPQILEKHLVGLELVKKNPIVIHFSEYVKPWNYECKHPLRVKYWYYQNMTPWRNMRKSFWSKRPYLHIPKMELLYILHYFNIKKTNNLYDKL